MPRKVIAYFCILFPFLSACMRDAKVVPPKIERQITLSCFISPDEDTIAAVVAWSKPLFTSQSNPWQVNPVQNATVVITGENGSLTLSNFFPDEFKPRYWAAQPEGFFEDGKTYSITIVEPGGKTVSSSTTIPVRKPLLVTPVIIDSSTQISTWGGGSEFNVRFSVSFTDPPTSGDRYRITGGYYSVFSGLVQDGDVWRLKKDSSYSAMFFNRSELYEDRAGNGETVTFNTGQQNIFIGEDVGFGCSGIGDLFYFMVLQTDDAYFRFHQYAENYFGDDPFSEPNPMYSNVKGGQGVFGSYLKHVAVLRRK